VPDKPAKIQLLTTKEKIIILVVVLILVLGGGGWWYVKYVLLAPKIEPKVISQVTPTTSLPSTLTGDETNNNQTTQDETNIKGENVTFGAFYKPLSEPLKLAASGVKLPLDVKSQVSNYYDTARKINLDPIVNNLNQDGFGTIVSPFTTVNNDFFGTYAEISQRSIPSLVTGDFLVYYYQNSLKQIYKDIESSFFYENIWRLTNDLYTTANGRYQERRQKVGVASDPLLEAERLEAAYFAGGLALLKPDSSQINSTEDINDSTKFKPSEARQFDFSIPSYLSDDLTNELALINAAKVTTKSPVLLYQRNYQEFKVPNEYTVSAKLHNFYLASRWYSSLFPLYFKDSTCPTCLLDREDWLINQTAAHLIANDLSASQSLKNDWAKIYKVISYFSGLRSELTYLHYQNVRTELFPKASLDEVFGTGSFDRLIKLRDKLATLEFKTVEGAYSRQSATDKPILGMRLLQTAYWPSESFYDQLTFANVGNHNHPVTAAGVRNSYLTGCQGAKDSIYRCRGLGYDVLAPVLEKLPTSTFITSNTDYAKYNSQLVVIRKQLADFKAVDWHNNNFWSTLNLASALANEKLTIFPYDNTVHWSERRVGSALASLTNLTLPADTWQVARDKASDGLEVSGDLTILNYIEPDARLADELVANTKMLFDSLVALGVVKDNDAGFSNLLSKMQTTRLIIRKELAKEKISSDDYQFISDFTNQFRVQKAGTKTATLTFFDAQKNIWQSTKQSIADLKLLLLVYDKDGKKILVAGPIFNYKEQ
jgi:hypothetical protein